MSDGYWALVICLPFAAFVTGYLFGFLHRAWREVGQYEREEKEGKA